jgi:hypothetical protein
MSVLFERHGDSFVIAWPDDGVGFAIERLREGYDGLRGSLIVEAYMAEKRGHLLGPVNLRLESIEDQTKLSHYLATRVNGKSQSQWQGLIIQACAKVGKAWRTPEPTISMDTYNDVRPIEYLVSGLIPEGETTILYGDGESAKSLCAMMIGLHVQTGSILPWETLPKCRNTLFLDWETTPKTAAARMRRISSGHGFPMPAVQYRQCFRSLEDEAASIREEISRKEIGLVIIDSIGFAAAGSLNDDAVARAALNTLRSFSPATRLVVAHVSKAEAERTNGKAKPFGSAFFWNGMRSGIEVRRAEDQPAEDQIDIALYHRKANDGRHHKTIGMRVMFDGLDGDIAFDVADVRGTPELHERMSLNSRIRDLLRSGAMSTVDIAEETGASKESVRVTLNRMPDVIRIDPGAPGRGGPATWGLQQR